MKVEHLQNSLKLFRIRVVTISSRFLVFLLLATFAFPISAVRAQTAGGVPMGMNLSGIVDWGSQLEFKDFMKKSREWIVGNDASWSNGGSMPMNANGYPLSVPNNGNFVKTVINVDIGGKYPAGQYTLKITGTGKVETGWAAESKTWNGPGTYKVQVNPTNAGIYLAIRESSASNPITEINFVAPGFENSYETSPFYPSFLERLQGMQVIRFMDFMRTNNSPVKTWADRAPYDYYTQGAERGVAPEYMVDLANTLQADAWIDIPHQADDNYVRQLATLLKDRLNTNRKVYIEYSNEVWNTIFAQHRYAQEKGAPLFPQVSPYEQQLRYQARRSGEIFAIFEQVFGGTSRLVRIIAGHGANPWTGEVLLSSLASSSINPSGKKADALAIAPYFDGVTGRIDDQASTISVDEIVTMASASMEQNFSKQVADNKATANKYNVRLIAYEGGQHITPNGSNNQVLVDKMAAANRHPRMRDIYTSMFNKWKAVNNDVFAVFSFVSVWGKWGSWGALEWMDQDPATAPKYQAVRAAMGSGSSSPNPTPPTTPAPAGTPCAQFQSGATIPTGFGVPWDVNSTSTLILKAYCNGNQTTASVGANTYIYNQAHGWVNNAWRSFTLTCTSAALVSGVWCPTSAQGTIPAGANDYVAYTCHWTGTKWNCGCRDAACTTSYWQLQKITR